jgi:glycosyltransferase involved in cell wall biosynthesis
VTDATDLTIVMPCLNEAETIRRCIEEARLGIERSGVSGEILVADNGSKDESVQIAERLGARVVHEQQVRPLADCCAHAGSQCCRLRSCFSSPRLWLGCAR